jgi:hypothetical protein
MEPDLGAANSVSLAELYGWRRFNVPPLELDHRLAKGGGGAMAARRLRRSGGTARVHSPDAELTALTGRS